MRRIPSVLVTALVAALTTSPSCSPASAAGGRPVDGGPSEATVHISFRTDEAELAGAVAEYEALWAEEGARIVAAMEAVSGLEFVTPEYADTAIVALVIEAPSNSGYRDRPMRLRASYPPDTKRATLVHELGHRLQTHLFTADEEEHGPLFLWVYDVWVELWGQDFADREVEVEKRRGDRYVQAWDAALALDREERRAVWRRLVRERSTP